MTVTIKKNVDVQAELKADKIKYQVKRDLSGDVQWTNMTQVGNLVTSVSVSTTFTTTGTTTNGFNFIKMPYANFFYSGASMGATILINGVTKASGSWGPGIDSDTWTPTPRTITLTGANPNTVQLKVWMGNGAYMGATFNSNMQRNDKTTVMATT